MERREARLLGATVAGLVAVALFGDQMLAAVPLLWPPGGSRWVTLALLVGFSLATPLVGGALLADRYLSE